MSEPFINRDLIDKIREARKVTFDADIAFDDTKEEERHLSEMYRIVANYEPKELAVCVAAALVKEPLIVWQVVAEYFDELRKGKKDEKD